nr:juvenile hormone esterase-like [Danaus plexippus plexippus]
MNYHKNINIITGVKSWPPLPPKPWSHVLDAAEHGATCPQWDMVALKFRKGEENCLFINVYTPTLQTDSKLPVMVYIHEGGFQSGSGNERMYGPNFLIRHDVILVTFNYRLELLGLLCLDTPEVPGNAGMKDMVAALRWVQNNIKQFGGDPDNVTIFGESGGAVSVTYLMLSPMAQGLFHKAIAQSGSCLADYAIDVNPVQRAFRVGKVLGKDTTDPYELLTYLQSLPDVHFVVAAYRYASCYSKYSSPVYMYRFNLVTELNWIQQMLGMTEHKGACHFDDVFYIFSNGMNREKYENSPILQEHIHRITKMWTDFAKTGNPTPDNSLGVTWSPYTATGKEYLQIGNELSMGRNAEKTRLDFWDRLYIEAGLPSLVKSNLSVVTEQIWICLDFRWCW